MLRIGVVGCRARATRQPNLQLAGAKEIHTGLPRRALVACVARKRTVNGNLTHHHARNVQSNRARRDCRRDHARSSDSDTRCTTAAKRNELLYQTRGNRNRSGVFHVTKDSTLCTTVYPERNFYLNMGPGIAWCPGDTGLACVAGHGDDFGTGQFNRADALRVHRES